MAPVAWNDTELVYWLLDVLRVKKGDKEGAQRIKAPNRHELAAAIECALALVPYSKPLAHNLLAFLSPLEPLPLTLKHLYRAMGKPHAVAPHLVPALILQIIAILEKEPVPAARFILWRNATLLALLPLTPQSSVKVWARVLICFLLNMNMNNTNNNPKTNANPANNNTNTANLNELRVVAQYVERLCERGLQIDTDTLNDLWMLVVDPHRDFVERCMLAKALLHLSQTHYKTLVSSQIRLELTQQLEYFLGETLTLVPDKDFNLVACRFISLLLSLPTKQAARVLLLERWIGILLVAIYKGAHASRIRVLWILIARLGSSTNPSILDKALNVPLEMDTEHMTLKCVANVYFALKKYHLMITEFVRKHIGVSLAINIFERIVWFHEDHEGEDHGEIVRDMMIQSDHGEIVRDMMIQSDHGEIVRDMMIQQEIQQEMMDVDIKKQGLDEKFIAIKKELCRDINRNRWSMYSLVVIAMCAGSQQTAGIFIQESIECSTESKETWEWIKALKGLSLGLAKLDKNIDWTAALEGLAMAQSVMRSLLTTNPGFAFHLEYMILLSDTLFTLSQITQLNSTAGNITTVSKTRVMVMHGALGRFADAWRRMCVRHYGIDGESRALLMFFAKVCRVTLKGLERIHFNQLGLSRLELGESEKIVSGRFRLSRLANHSIELLSKAEDGTLFSKAVKHVASVFMFTPPFFFVTRRTLDINFNINVLHMQNASLEKLALIEIQGLVTLQSRQKAQKLVFTMNAVYPSGKVKVLPECGYAVNPDISSFPFRVERRVGLGDQLRQEARCEVWVWAAVVDDKGFTWETGPVRKVAVSWR